MIVIRSIRAPFMSILIGSYLHNSRADKRLHPGWDKVVNYPFSCTIPAYFRRQLSRMSKPEHRSHAAALLAWSVVSLPLKHDFFL